MSPTATLSDVKKSLSALIAVTTSASKTSDVGKSMAQLRSALTLLELSSPPSVTVGKLAEMLRQPMLPLYREHPSPAYAFCSAVLDFVFARRLSAFESGSKEPTNPWEAVQRGLLSGLLDFLDADPSESAKSAIGNALYPTLCNRCFPQSATDKQRFGRDLICTAYNLLLVTSLAHTENRRKLRNATLLGGRRIGLALSLSREYLVVEALLDLIANLLPPTVVKDKRQDFVNSTFDATFFPGSSQLRNILLCPTSSVTDWEVLSQDIVNTLAASHIAFPQPFEIRSTKVDDFVPNLVNRIYLDAEGFTASIDINGTYETFHVATQTVELIHIPPVLADSHLLISMKLNRFPDMGQSPSDHQKNGSVDLTFELNNHHVKRFIDALNARSLGKRIVRTARKMSKLNVDLALDFNHNGVPYTEKATRVLSIDAASDQLMSPSSAKLCVRPDEDDDGLQIAKSVDHISKVLEPDVGKAVTNLVRPPSSPVVVMSSPPRAPRVHFNEGTSTRTDFKGHKMTSVKDKQLLAEYDENDGAPSSKQPVAKTTRSARNKRHGADTPSEDVELPVIKRRRVEPSPIFSKPVQPNKRYRKKGRSSSPVPSDRVSLSAETVNPNSRLTRASVKAGAAKREAALKSKDVGNKEGDSHASKMKGAGKAKAAADPGPSSKSNVQAIKPGEEKNLRRSGRITRVSELKVTPQRSSADKVQKLIAPTYEDALQDVEDEENKLEVSIKKSSDNERLPRQLSTHTDPLIVPPPAHRPSPAVAMDFNVVDTVMDDDFVSPLTTPCPWDREPNVNLREPETIDLTQDDASPHLQRSPVPMVKREKKSRHSLPSVQPSSAAPEISMLELPKPASKRIDRTLPTQDVLQDMVASRPQDQAVMEPIRLSTRTNSASIVGKETITAPSKLQASSMLRAEPLKPAKLFFEFQRPEETSVLDRAGPPHLFDYPKSLQSHKYATPSKVIPPSRKPALNHTSNVKSFVKPRNAISDSSRLLSFSPSTNQPPTRKPLGQFTLDSKSSRPPMEETRKYTKALKSKKREPSYDIVYNTEPGEDYEDHDREEADDYGIAQVLNEIQSVLIQKISHKFDHVKADVRLGRANILREAADNMNDMRNESVAHFNLLIDLETEYASYRRKLIDSFEQAALVHTEIGQQVGETLRLHDRHMLSKVFPDVLPPLPSGLVHKKLA